MRRWARVSELSARRDVTPAHTEVLALALWALWVWFRRL